MCEVYYLNEENLGSCFLAVGQCAVLFDPGMAYFADTTIRNIRNILGEKKVDAVFLTHSHYDHVAALPYIRECWPDVKVYGAAYAKKILEKPSARETMYQLSKHAAAAYGCAWTRPYKMDLLYIDEAVGDGEEIVLGDIRIKVMAAIGHTRCSLSFIINDTIMIASETLGVMQAGEYSPTFLIDYESAEESIRRCRGLLLDKFCLMHHGIIEQPGEQLWQWCAEGLERSKQIIFQILEKYDCQEARMAAMAENFWKPQRKGGWPREAFDLNAQAMLKVIEKYKQAGGF